jgi:hypothetical protein
MSRNAERASIAEELKKYTIAVVFVSIPEEEQKRRASNILSVLVANAIRVGKAVDKKHGL